MNKIQKEKIIKLLQKQKIINLLHELQKEWAKTGIKDFLCVAVKDDGYISAFSRNDDGTYFFNYSQLVDEEDN